MTTLASHSLDATPTPTAVVAAAAVSAATATTSIPRPTQLSGTCPFPAAQSEYQHQHQHQHQQDQQQQQQNGRHYYHSAGVVGSYQHYSVATSSATGLTTVNGNSNLYVANGNLSCNSNNNNSTNSNNGAGRDSHNCSASNNGNGGKHMNANASFAAASASDANGVSNAGLCSRTENPPSALDGFIDGSTLDSPALKIQQQQQAHNSRVDAMSLGGSSSANSQMSSNNNVNSSSRMNGANHSQSSSSNTNNISSILKGSKENLLQNNTFCNGGRSHGGSGVGGTIESAEHCGNDDPGDGLGPLPPKWETAYTERGELYFIDHNTGTSHWLDPRLSKFQKKSLEDCTEDELPYGWEKIEDSLYGTYYIDHVNRRTQYENPVLEAKRRAAEQKQKQQQQPQRPQTPSTQSVLNGAGASVALSSVSSSGSTLSTVDISQRGMQPPPMLTTLSASNHNVYQDRVKPSPLPPPSSSSVLPYKFTRNPAELQGERITTALLKSARGLGITIVGGDGDGVEEFLQIKSIVPNGPAWLDGQLQMGDVLIYVNDTCVLGFTHHEMVNIFQSILPGETVTLEVCRGYPLPFDPNDPNTEVVTTIAVDGINAEPEKQRLMLMDLNMDGNYNFLDISGGSSANGNTSRSHAANGGGAVENGAFVLTKKPEVHTFSIVKGAMGFGFTIADSAYGQKVKKILDRNCCTQLQEGDILLEINDVVVRNKSHVDVVQMLKECSRTEPTVVKIQRAAISVATTAAVSPSGSGNLTKLRKNFGGGCNNGLYRSKTPTADLYSTMQKEILPIRPKTPLVDTRRVRVQTPNNELNHEDDAEVAAANNTPKTANLDDAIHKDRSLAESKSHLLDGNKSNNSLSEIDAINQDIPFMDPYPKLVASLGERLAGVTMSSDTVNSAYHAAPTNPNARTTASGIANYENHAEYVSGNSGNYSSIYGLAHMPPTMSPLSGALYGAPAATSSLGLMAPVQSANYHHHHESCFCYECQDYRNNRMRHPAQLPPMAAAMNHQQQQQQHQQQQQQHHHHHHQQHQQPSPLYYYAGHAPGGGHHSHSQYSPASSVSLQVAHMQNERMQKRVNELLSDRRRVGFSPLDHSHAPAATGGYSPSQQHQHQLQLQPQQHSPASSSISHHPAWSSYTGGQSAALMRNGLDVVDDLGGGGGGEQYLLSEVTLERQALGFGFRIVGGTEEGSQVTVGHIVPGGAADNDHRITTGDEILSIDGINVVNASHHKVVSLMGEAALRGQVTMILRRRARAGTHHQQPLQSVHFQQSPTSVAVMQNPTQSAQLPLLRAPLVYPYDVIVSRHENEGFGFVIISSSNQYYGSTIGKLIPGSPADRCGELKVGDRIVAVNRIDIAGMSHGDVVNLIKESGLHVRLTIGCPKEGAMIAAAPTVPAGGGLMLNSAQASPGQISQSGQLQLSGGDAPVGASTTYYERSLVGDEPNASAAAPSPLMPQQEQQQQQQQQQSPVSLPTPPQL